MLLKLPYREYYHDIIKKLPLPDCKFAENCMETVKGLKEKINVTLDSISKKLDCFQNDLNEFFEQTVFICQGYKDKLKQIEESSMNNWLKYPPKFIDQEKYIFNIKQKQDIAVKIE